MASRAKLDPTGWVVTIAIAIPLVIVTIVFRLSQKWHSAFLLMVVPFWVIGTLPRRKRRSPYWTVFCLCAALQILLVWIVFAVALKNVEVVGMFYMIPIVMVEGVFIYGAILRLENWIESKRIMK